jgi:hypothetical protein
MKNKANGTAFEQRLQPAVYYALDRLARSAWGKQGIGKCELAPVRRKLADSGFAESVKGEPKRIMAITLEGFRALERERILRQIQGLAFRKR